MPKKIESLCNLEAEQSILGAILIDMELQRELMPKLFEQDFLISSHKIIFAAMDRVYHDRKPIDLITLSDELEKPSDEDKKQNRKSNKMQEAGGLAYITELASRIPSTANYKEYFDIVKRDSVLRKIVNASTKISENALNLPDSQEAIMFAEKQIADISGASESSHLSPLTDDYLTVINKFEKSGKNKNASKGVLTGFKRLDALTNGFQKSDLILLAARPGIGKTSLAMNFAEYAAVHGKKTIAVFSLEMSRAQLAQRLICSFAGVDMSKAQQGEIPNLDWAKIYKAADVLSKAKIYVDDSSLITPIEILNKCRRIKSQMGLDMIIIDYIQLMSYDKKKRPESRQQEIADISRYLKLTAKELDIPVLAISQLSRAMDKDQRQTPILSDLRESGAIEQDADIVMFIHYPELKKDKFGNIEKTPQEAMKKGMVMLSVAKHRNGSTGEIKMMFKGENTKFKEIEHGVREAEKDDSETVDADRENEYNKEGLNQLGGEDFIPPEGEINEDDGN